MSDHTTTCSFFIILVQQDKLHGTSQEHNQTEVHTKVVSIIPGVIGWYKIVYLRLEAIERSLDNSKICQLVI